MEKQKVDSYYEMETILYPLLYNMRKNKSTDAVRPCGNVINLSQSPNWQNETRCFSK